MMETAMRAAKEAGKVLEKYFETSLTRRFKDDSSIVTDADEEAEKVVVGILQKEYPDHGFLGEEGGRQGGDSEYQWVIDPLDGTSNFANGIPIFCVSIALVQNGKQLIAVLYNPVTNTLFSAEAGKGAFYNGYQMRVSRQDASTAMISIGTSSRTQDKEMVRKLFSGAANHVKSVRYLGSAALELGYLARGGTEGFINVATKKWDYAAGTLLVLEAGGTITDFEGNPWNFEQNYFVASNGITHKALLELARESRE